MTRDFPAAANVYTHVIWKQTHITYSPTHTHPLTRFYWNKKIALSTVDNGPDVSPTYKRSSGVDLFFLDLSEESWNKNLTDRLSPRKKKL